MGYLQYLSLGMVFLALLVSGCSKSPTAAVIFPIDSQQVAREVPTGKMEPVIHLNRCEATPAVLEVKRNTQITFQNDDDQEHAIFIDRQQHTLSAKGALNFTPLLLEQPPYNDTYFCDEKPAVIFISS